MELPELMAAEIHIEHLAFSPKATWNLHRRLD